MAGLRAYLRDHHRSLHMVIMTGDLTQRARKKEFLEARDFLKTLELPVYVIPGNHDIPLFHLAERFFRPYYRFNKYLSPWSPTFYEDDKVLICGLRTTNKFTVKKELLHNHEILLLEERLKGAGEKLKIIASHHPLTPDHLSPGLQRILKAGPQLLLWGHEHQSRIVTFPEFPQTIAVAGGTSISSRTRTEQNSFNEIIYAENELSVRTLHLEGNAFINNR